MGDPVLGCIRGQEELPNVVPVRAVVKLKEVTVRLGTPLPTVGECERGGICSEIAMRFEIKYSLPEFDVRGLRDAQYFRHRHSGWQQRLKWNEPIL